MFDVPSWEVSIFINVFAEHLTLQNTTACTVQLIVALSIINFYFYLHFLLDS